LGKFFAFLVLLVLAAAGYMAYGLLRPVGSSQQKFVLLRPGSSTRHIAQQLQAESVIPSWPAFLLLNDWRLQPLKAGEYLFDHPANAIEVYDRLARGDIYTHTVVIPEGYNIYDIAATIEGAGLGPAQQFEETALSSGALVADLDPQAKSLEGYLFPDTYHFTRTQDVHDMAAAMVRRFRQEAREIGLSADVHRVVTMASIVEKETAAPEERPVVAGVYYNRMARKMSLGADPTVIYAALLAGRYRGTIYQSDLDSDSPYNTYRVAGLPPGPIANPGRSALLAAMHPAETGYLYFVSDNNGHHRFAKSAAEHAKNVAAYRRAVAGGH
jgi:peptidoglycan lytic transglycosylase G